MYIDGGRKQGNKAGENREKLAVGDDRPGQYLGGETRDGAAISHWDLTASNSIPMDRFPACCRDWRHEPSFSTMAFYYFSAPELPLFDPFTELGCCIHGSPVPSSMDADRASPSFYSCFSGSVVPGRGKSASASTLILTA